ncbi:MAG: trp RNA-binding attenuation protein MtrB [Syntrophomonadaceae bacterium]|nr:trp RNA-binding attenuation protein MtrB [Syntrophomonadaceae bacterium]
MNEDRKVREDYIVIKALENGVTIIGLTRGKETKFHHTEKLDRGEIMIAQFTEHTSAVKIRGHAEVLTQHGRISNAE